jgi:antitoxin PrlF
MRATVTSKGQITIPAPIRNKLGLSAGTVLEFDQNANYLRATKAVDVERMLSVVGVLKKSLRQKTTLQWLDELRGPVELPPKCR